MMLGRTKTPPVPLGRPNGRELSPAEYELFRKLIYDQVGINLGPNKLPLVQARLGKRLHEGAFQSFRQYYDHVVADKSGTELSDLIDSLTTNTTHLYREKRHFDFLSRLLAGWVADPAQRARHGTVRIWSAACSQGDEPYSIAMCCDDALRQTKMQARILATDISTRVLERARLGHYQPDKLGELPPEFRTRYFTKVKESKNDYIAVNDAIKKAIQFERLNLMQENYPLTQSQDVIFCRNVMIYFDRDTQENLVRRLSRHVAPGGYLFCGHSESLNNIKHELKYVEPSIYQRPAR